jgi:hypothetical protein
MDAADGALEALLLRLRAEQASARRAGAAGAAREALAALPGAAALARQLALAHAVRGCLERAVAGKERALVGAEQREAAARAALAAGCRPDAVTTLAWREADEWQRRAREAEEAQRDACTAVAEALAADAAREEGGGSDCGDDTAPDATPAPVPPAHAAAQLLATQHALAAAETELQEQSALVRGSSLRPRRLLSAHSHPVASAGDGAVRQPGRGAARARAGGGARRRGARGHDCEPRRARGGPARSRGARGGARARARRG